MRARLAGVVAAVVCAGLSIFLALNARDASVVREANEQGAAGHYARAAQKAAGVRRAPARGQALLTRARALTAARRLDDADGAWAAVARRDPNNWQVHYQWARALGVLGADPAVTRARYRRARELNPRLPPLQPRPG